MTNEAAFKQIAFRALNCAYAVLAPESEAVVTYPEFDPCRAAQPIARVDWPAVVNMRNVTLVHFIFDGAPVPQEAK